MYFSPCLRSPSKCPTYGMLCGITGGSLGSCFLLSRGEIATSRATTKSKNMAVEVCFGSASNSELDTLSAML